MSEGKVRPYIEKYYPEYYSWNEYPVDKCVAIRTNKEEWGILSNLYSTILIVDGKEFKSSEQLFQLMKFTDKETIQTLYSVNGLTPKMKAKKYENGGFRRPDWGRIIVDCMKFCLQTKYDQCEDFRIMLQRTTGLYIVEDETKRKTNKNGTLRRPDTWGVVRQGDKFIGSNLLGRLLMELRDNGNLEYSLPDDIFDFLKYLKN